MGRNFITYFDQHYLPKGLAMLRSLLRHNPDSEIYVVCCDDRTMDVVMDEDRNHVVPISLAVVEKYDKALAVSKTNRTWVEYLWTLTPTVMLWAIDNICSMLAPIAYVDADLYFFASLDPLYTEVGNAVAAVIPHRWTPRHAVRLKPNGIYNVSWTYAQNSFAAMRFLTEWRNLCIDWCYSSGEHGVGEQGHLDQLVPKYKIHEVKHLGANLAPWSQEQYQYWKEGNNLIIDNYQLLFYHFHEFKHLENGTVIQRTGYSLNEAVVSHIYLPYENEIREVCDELAKS